MRGVDGQHIHLAGRQLLRALQKIARGSNRRTDPQPSLRILSSAGVLQLLLNVLDRDQALEHVLVVDHQQLFHTVPVQNFFGLFKRGADRNCDQILLRHHLRNRHVRARFKPQIAIGQDADQLAVLRHRDT